jgi:hypothetical protein
LALSLALVKLAPSRCREGKRGGWGVCRIVSGATSLIVAILAGATLSAEPIGTPTPVVGEEDLPIAGTYAKDRLCRGDGSDPADLLVKITGKAIESNMGSCSILGRKRKGKSFSMQVECKIPGDLVLLSDITFTLRNDNTLDFVDEYNTSPAVLHKCGK